MNFGGQWLEIINGSPTTKARTGRIHSSRMPNENRITNALKWIAGWWLAEKNIAQISLNLTDMDVIISSPPTFHLQRIYPIAINQPFCNCSIFNIFSLVWMQVTPMHVAYEEAKKDAEEIGVAVTGSELVSSKRSSWIIAVQLKLYKQVLVHRTTRLVSFL